MRARVVSEQSEVGQQLAELGLTEEVLREAVLRGEVARNACTANDPRPFPGQTAWARTVRGLRDQLLPEGWKRNDMRNFPTVVSPNGSIRIAVATGDENVGNPHAEPKTKSAKGPVMETAVANNNLQYDLFIFPETLDASVEDMNGDAPIREGCITWVLLFHRTEREVRCELSLPEGLGENFHLESWTTRIMLGSLESDPAPHLPIVNNGPDIEVQVVRKQNG